MGTGAAAACLFPVYRGNLGIAAKKRAAAAERACQYPRLQTAMPATRRCRPSQTCCEGLVLLLAGYIHGSQGTVCVRAAKHFLPAENCIVWPVATRVRISRPIRQTNSQLETKPKRVGPNFGVPAKQWSTSTSLCRCSNSATLPVFVVDGKDVATVEQRGTNVSLRFAPVHDSIPFSCWCACP